MNLFKFFRNLILFATMMIFVNGCGPIKKPDWSKPSEPDGKERARKNAQEGKGFSLGGKSNKGTNFEFASSNPMWRSALDVLDFITLSSVDYAGGLIITDWYSENNNNEAIKITVRFLSNEIRADGLDIILHKKICDQKNNCTISKIDNKIIFEIKDTIIRKAAILDAQDSKTAKESRPKKKWGGNK